ncbi:MAG: hypothetical protein G01um101419_513 [Parcubacteria group bacterium Gr01-1014_19]|nr:MAG: hypothetical protein G01um101419_513 [Parcubacteria group bacterium Gr01-1014_19]
MGDESSTPEVKKPGWFYRNTGNIVNGIILAPFICIFATLIYLADQDVKDTQKKVDAAFNGPELTLKELAQYQGYYAKIQFFRVDLYDRVLELSQSYGDKNPVYVHVSEDVWSCFGGLGSQNQIDVVDLERRIAPRIKEREEAQKERERKDKEHQEALERIRRGESPVDPKSETANSERSEK